jgi:hypothetical protein
LVDDTQSGRPVTTVTDVNVDNADQLLKGDRKVSLRELSGSLNVSLKSVLHVITVELSMSRMCAVLVPHGLSDEKKRKHVDVCQ